MAWWHKIFRRQSRNTQPRTDYYIPFSLYNIDGSRCIEVHDWNNGDVTYIEMDWIEGTTFKRRGTGEFGPFPSHKAAEQEAAASAWFNGRAEN